MNLKQHCRLNTQVEEYFIRNKMRMLQSKRRSKSQTFCHCFFKFDQFRFGMAERRGTLTLCVAYPGLVASNAHETDSNRWALCHRFGS